MSGGFGRAALAGVGLALLALVVGGLLLASRLVELPDPDEPVTEVLVIAIAPDESGGETAALALRVDYATDQVEVLDTERDAPIAGTSARNAREAYPFGGGAAVSKALAPQTGGRTLSWIVLAPDTWAAMIDDTGGAPLRLERGISVYLDGRLTVVEPGDRTLTGREAVALASAVAYVDDAQRRPIHEALGSAFRSAISDSERSLATLVSSGEARSDLHAGELPPGP